MVQKYKAVLTTTGAAKIAAATAGGAKVNLKQMAVGDGGGTLPMPDPAQTKLIAEKHRAVLNKVIVDPKHKNYLVAELIIPPEIGGFWMRELGLYDDTGALIAVSNMAESYKPLLSEGSGRAQTLRMVVIVSDMDSVNLQIDASTVLATQEYVDDKLLEHEQSRRHPDATLKEKGFTQLSSATNSDSEVLASTPKAVKVAYDLANAKYTAQDATTARKGIVQLSSATDSTSEMLASTSKAVKAAYDIGKTANDNAQTANSNAGKANENANTRLEKSKNLSDLTNKAEARKSLELGSAATSSVQKSVTDNTSNSLMINGAWGLGTSAVGMVDSDILSPTSIGNTFFNQGGGAANNHFGGYGTGIHLSYGSNGNNQQRLTANIFADSAGNLSVEWLAVNKSDGAVVTKYLQKLYGPLNKPSATDNDFVSKANGGKYNSAIAVKADSRAITLYPKTKDSAACYLIQRNNDETPQWYVGRGTDGGYNVTLHNYSGGGSVTLVADGTITLSNYSAFDARYQAKGSYTPAGQAYTKAESEARYVKDIRMGANLNVTWGSGGGTVPAGCVLTGGNFDDDREYAIYAPVQKFINGIWYNIGRA